MSDKIPYRIQLHTRGRNSGRVYAQCMEGVCSATAGNHKKIELTVIYSNPVDDELLEALKEAQKYLLYYYTVGAEKLPALKKSLRNYNKLVAKAEDK